MEQSRHGDGITSVKVHHQPGGASSFSLAHDNGEPDDRFGDRKRTTKPAAGVAGAAGQSAAVDSVGGLFGSVPSKEEEQK